MLWKTDLIRNIRFDYDTHNYQDIITYSTKRYNGSVEVTECNRKSLKEYFGLVRDNCKAILEIGVCRNNLESFTHVFLNNKLESTIYVGIDMDDKSFLNDHDRNIHTIKSSSFNVDQNIKKFKNLGIDEFDFIFIDGDHSVQGVLNDWEYSKLLSKDGIIGFHDVSWHVGPHAFINALDQEKWNVVSNTCPNDWGVGFVWRK